MLPPTQQLQSSWFPHHGGLDPSLDPAALQRGGWEEGQEITLAASCCMGVKSGTAISCSSIAAPLSPLPRPGRVAPWLSARAIGHSNQSATPSTMQRLTPLLPPAKMGLLLLLPRPAVLLLSLLSSAPTRSFYLHGHNSKKCPRACS